MGVLTAARRHGCAVVTALAVLALMVLRVRLVHRQPSVDEAGYLAVARQWHGAGREVYTGYFLDRPPLLVGLYRLGDLCGGLTGLRVIGVLCAVVATLGAAETARRVAGPRAAAVAAVLAAAWLASPATAAPEVNGELLSAPFIAVGLAATAAALTTRGRRGLVCAAGAGVVGVAAVLVKQNMFDVGVFLLAATALGARLVGRRRALHLVGAAAGGAVLGGLVVVGWAWLEGSGPRAVLFATYVFRLRASAVLADHSSYDQHAGALLRAFLVSGLGPAVVLAWLAAWPARHRRDPADVVVLALGVTLVYDAVSVLSGQQYWTHYLIQLVVPVSVVVAVASTRLVRLTALVGVLVVGSCTVATATLGAASPVVALDLRVGRAIGAAAHARDTIVVFPGHGDTTYASGLRSPYPYLWRLQSETLDPRIARLSALLLGRSAPTWVVDYPNLGLDPRQRDHLHTDLSDDYTPVGRYGDAEVYLHDGVSRSTPVGRAGSGRHADRAG